MHKDQNIFHETNSKRKNKDYGGLGEKVLQWRFKTWVYHVLKQMIKAQCECNDIKFCGYKKVQGNTSR